MKKVNSNSFFLLAVTATLILGMSIVIGCNKPDELPPGERVPNVPASTRGDGGGGGAPGEAGDFKKKTTETSYIIKQTSVTQS